MGTMGTAALGDGDGSGGDDTGVDRLGRAEPRPAYRVAITNTSPRRCGPAACTVGVLLLTTCDTNTMPRRNDAEPMTMLVANPMVVDG